MNIVDMHCDTIGRFYFSGEKGKTKEGLLENSFQVDLKKMKKGEYLLQNFAMFVPFGEVEDPFKTAMEMIDLYYCELEKNSSLIAPVFSFQGYYEKQRSRENECSFDHRRRGNGAGKTFLSERFLPFRRADDRTDLEFCQSDRLSEYASRM